MGLRIHPKVHFARDGVVPANNKDGRHVETNILYIGEIEIAGRYSTSEFIMQFRHFPKITEIGQSGRS